MVSFIMQTKLLEYTLRTLRLVYIVIIKVFLFYFHVIVIYKISLKRSHLISAIKRRIWCCPYVPHDIAALLSFQPVVREKSLSDVSLQYIKQSLATILFTVDIYLCEASILLHRDASVEKQIAIIYLVHAASFKQQPNVVFKLLAMNKRASEPLYDFLFPLCQPVRISRVNCRKACIKKLISSALKLYSALFIINMFQKQSFLHAILRPLLNELSLQLETYDGNGLVHLLYQITLHIICATWSHLKHKSGAWVILVSFQRKRSKRKHIYAIALLDHVQITISDTVSDNSCNTCRISCGCPHPDNIVIAPLYIQRVISAQPVHYQMWPRSPVIYITKHMQMVNSKSLNKLGKHHYKLLRSAQLHCCIDD